jgi:serine-type D-Ala-D-Ala carboxypeptidase/endopeptidase (penicillin-binding protein 4)
MSSLKKTTSAFKYFLLLTSYFLASCSVEKQISRSAREQVLNSKGLQTAHVGISIYEPSTGKYWFGHQADKYFVPASNTKIPTCYAAMKYLGDSLISAYIKRKDTTICIRPNADPTFLHPDFPNQPLLSLLKEADEIFLNTDNEVRAYGSGWVWNDYDESYMPERNDFPMFGNLLWLNTSSTGRDDTSKFILGKKIWIKPKYFVDKVFPKNVMDNYSRHPSENRFYIDSISGSLAIPFKLSGGNTDAEILSSVLNKTVEYGFLGESIAKEVILHSQPTDSLLKPMMHRSDNFFAEQSLLMVSNKLLNIMNESKLIDSLLKTDFKDLPQKPRWADGSGLSRYNLFTPMDFVSILNKMKNEFGMERIKLIFPTGGEGTISSYYKADSGYIYAKTGTLSGVVALSGYLTTKKNKELIFSVLVNNHQTSATEVRRAVEKFLQGVRKEF